MQFTFEPTNYKMVFNPTYFVTAASERDDEGMFVEKVVAVFEEYGPCYDFFESYKGRGSLLYLSVFTKSKQIISWHKNLQAH